MDIQIIIPLSVLGDAKDLTPQAIRDALEIASTHKDLKKKVSDLEKELKDEHQRIRETGQYIQDIYEDEGITTWQAAVKMREAIEEIKNYRKDENQ